MRINITTILSLNNKFNVLSQKHTLADGHSFFCFICINTYKDQKIKIKAFNFVNDKEIRLESLEEWCFFMIFL